MFSKKICVVLLGVLSIGFNLVGGSEEAFAKKASEPERIIFVPHDNRPISDEQTADTIRQLGYEVIVPPDELLGGRENLGDPDKLWEWLEDETGVKKNADKKNNIKAVVLSGDAMLYGSLVASRKHDIPVEVLKDRVNRFAVYRKTHPTLKTYVFSSIMRTPRSGEAASEEPGYYKDYGADIFRYTGLLDKKEMGTLTPREDKELQFLTELIPPTALDDWMARRSKNFSVNKEMIDLTRANTFTYFALGRDDNAPFSQTHRESRKLSAYGVDLGVGKFQNMAGIDEFGLLMLTRAVNDITMQKPFVYVDYNRGRGAKTVPSYSDETIDETIRSHIVCAGGMYVKQPERADVVLLVNTRPDGSTGEANYPENNGKLTPAVKNFVDMVEKAVWAGQPVAIADISYANGSDNALMDELNKRGLLFRIQAYSGWNTATNSTGFVLGQGMLANRMSDDGKDRLLLVRYLDDWVYQANVRQTVARQIGWFRGSGLYSSLNDKKQNVEYRTAALIKRFADYNFPPFDGLDDIKVEYPWNRMFESRIILSK